MPTGIHWIRRSAEQQIILKKITEDLQGVSEFIKPGL